ncbi:DnaJ domain-containing protein [Lipomyces oligophaga]|uniref:DnaJ domain-containing protein n=1 Tax=Lipomyces oligophaga TaxID=45792 RepID=UPI0034CE73E6
MKTCYYEVLETSRDASSDEIRKAYRRQALLLHPDKNIDNVEEATQKFAVVQAAYEVLSDPDERAWYDSHREQILRDEQSGKHSTPSGGSSPVDAGTTSADILRFFDPSLFAIKNDSKIGFFTIARQIFDQLAQEERDADESKDGESESESGYKLPTFGNGKSIWSEEVKYFYDVWSSFSTRRAFAWCDLYNLANAPDRRVRRAMEKENQKSRESAKKEYSETVRAFVEFLRKRDPRVVFENEELRAKRKQEQEKKVKEQAARQRAAYWKNVQQYEVPDWADHGEQDIHEAFWNQEFKSRKTRKHQDQGRETGWSAEQDRGQDQDQDKKQNQSPNYSQGQEELYNDLDEPYFDPRKAPTTTTTTTVHDPNSNSDSDSHSEGEQVEIYECVMCRKSFKSEQQLDAHEKSKKHLKTVKEVVKRMRMENKSMGLEEAFDGVGI